MLARTISSCNQPPAARLGRARMLPSRKSITSGGPDMCDATQMRSACSSALMADTIVRTSMSTACTDTQLHSILRQALKR